MAGSRTEFHYAPGTFKPAWAEAPDFSDEMSTLAQKLRELLETDALFVLVGFFQVLGLTAVTEPLNRFLIRIFEFLPQLIAPVILTAVAWLVATALRFVVRRVLERTDLDRRLRLADVHHP